MEVNSFSYDGYIKETEITVGTSDLPKKLMIINEFHPPREQQYNLATRLSGNLVFDSLLNMYSDYN